MPASPAPPLLERLGVFLLRRLPRPERSRLGWGDDLVHILNPEEHARLRAVERRATLRAAGVGALTGFVGAVAEIMASPELGFVESSLAGWGLILAVVGLSTALELIYLFYFTLQSVEELAFIAGVDLSADQDEEIRLLRSLARAALEVPNPPTPRLGVDPRRESSRLQLLGATVLYKAKVGLTNLILKTLLQRILGRMGVRYAAAYVAIPVVAIWDAIVIVRVLREARIRVIGPSAVHILLELALPEAPSIEAQRAFVGVAAACIMRGADMHPNLLALLEALRRRFPAVDELHLPARSDHILTLLLPLRPEEQGTALELLAIAAVLTGRLHRRTRRLLQEVARAVGRRCDPRALRVLLERFTQGLAIDREQLVAIFPPAP